jgi:hypothetical protein
MENHRIKEELSQRKNSRVFHPAAPVKRFKVDFCWPVLYGRKMNESGDTVDLVAMIGKGNLQWLATEFCRETRLKDLPEEILDRASSLDITLRDYSRDRNAVTAIALITFAYQLGGKRQEPRYGSNDLFLLKALANKEKRRRAENKPYDHPGWDLPLFELVTGEVGEAVRATKLITNPF